MRLLMLSTLVLQWVLVVPAQASPAEDAESLVRATYYEGLPYAAVRALPPEACPRLLSLLGDPDAATTHANVVTALGILECDGAFEAISAIAANAGPGEVDRTTYRTLRACPAAMGHLATRDDRALGWLLARTDGTPGRAAASWSFRQQHGPRLRAAQRGRAMNALAVSGRPEAKRRLAALAQATDPTDRNPARDALALLEAVQREGRAHALDTPRGREVGR